MKIKGIDLQQHFLIPQYLQSDSLNLPFFKLSFLDLTEFIV